MDDTEQLLKTKADPSLWISCYRFPDQHQRFLVLMGVMFSFVLVIVVSMLYNNLSFGLTNHITSLTIVNNGYALSTLSPSTEIYSIHGSNLTSNIIVFDAGSTGTRIHIFKFSYNGHGSPLLLDEIFFEIKPGLSFYASDPAKAEYGICQLLEKAKEVIPKSQWNATPISLKATAGLRLLPEQSAKQLLQKVEKVFKKNEFLVLPDSVSIMGGIDEGLLAWVTVNYLTGKINKPNETYGILDLGGGSTQISFSTNLPQDIPETFKKEFFIFENNYQMYVHSYLGFGLMSARYQMFLQNKIQISESNSSVLFSSCIHPKFSSTWIHEGTNFTIRGLQNFRYGFKNCYNSAKTIVKKSIQPPLEINQKQFYLFSYFFDRAIDSKVVDSSGGKIRIKKFLVAANTACANSRTETIFLCMDLSYISALLLEGYEFSKETEVFLAKKINDMEVSWALGDALKILEKLDHRQ